MQNFNQKQEAELLVLEDITFSSNPQGMGVYSFLANIEFPGKSLMEKQTISIIKEMVSEKKIATIKKGVKIKALISKSDASYFVYKIL
ncbi:hypothetical protein [Treponema denticola]|uniref:hypothetical protein n=1 Tax=Treponema denticola TaxID=158 RepID=UPI0020A250F9|nr:hypothetical protein [Treponema denticola]UTC81877.1 hypothetical protein HGJ18_01155 [Treponema denticola]